MTERIIAIGDIHGCAPALRAVIQAIDPTPLHRCADDVIPFAES